MNTDPIADMLNRIVTAAAVKKTDVLVPFSMVKEKIAEILSREGFIGEIKKVTKGKTNFLKITLKYQDGAGAIEGYKRISKPGQRIYQKSSEVRKVRGGFGISIVSTSQGLQTDKEARKNHLGGEVMCNIW